MKIQIKKIILSLIIFFWILNINLSFWYNASLITSDWNITLTTQMTSYDLEVSENWNYLFVIDETWDKIRKFNFWIPFDINTLSLTYSQFLSISDTQWRWLSISKDWKHIYMIWKTNMIAREYLCSTAWDLSTCFSNSTLSVFTANSSNFSDIWINWDWTKFVTLHDNNWNSIVENTIKIYSLSTPYLLSSATLESTHNFPYTPHYINVFQFSEDWSVFVYVSWNSMYFYDLITPFDITTRVFNSSKWLTDFSGYITRDWSKIFSTDLIDENTKWYTTHFIDFYIPPIILNKTCEDYTSSIATLTNEQKYNLQWQTFTNSWFIQNTVSWKNIYWFWFNKNSNWTGSFLNYFISNLDSFNDVKFYNSSNVEETSTGWILSTFTNSWYYLLENYFFAKWTVNDPAIYLQTFNKFQKINVKSSDVYAYRLYRKVEWEWTLILKNCITNTPCDISQVSSSLWYNSYDEILIVPFSTAWYVKFTDYKINDIEIYSYTSEYLTYPVCYYEDGSIDINWETFTPEEWEEFKQNEIKNGEAKPTAYCNELNFFQYIKDPVCLSSWLSTWFQKNIWTSPAYQYFMKFLNFISYKIEPSTQISIFFFDANLVWFNEYKLNLDPENLNFENYSNYEPDFETDNGKILLYIIKWFFIIFFYVLIFIFLFVVFFVHNFIFSWFLKVIKMAFPNLLDFNFKEKMNFISYIALIPLITVFLFLFNTFLLEYIVIFKSIFTQVFNILGLIFDTLYWVFTSDFWGFIIFFNIINTYLTWAFIIALFAIILIKYWRL